MRTDLLLLAALAALSAGCAAPRAPATAARDDAAPSVAGPTTELEDALDIVRCGEPLEPRFYELADVVACRPLAPASLEARLAHAIGRGLAERIAKKREWGARPGELAADLARAAACASAAPELFDAGDLRFLVDEVFFQRAPRDVAEFLDAWTLGLSLPRSEAAAAAAIEGAGGRFPEDGILAALFYRGFRIDDATLRSYAATVVAGRFAVDDLLFVMKRTDAPGEVAAKLPAFADRLLAWVLARPASDEGAAARRRIFHNGVVALVEARRSGVPLPATIFDRSIRPAAERADVAVDDLAAAYAAFGAPTEDLLDARLARVHGARATLENLVELFEVASLMIDAAHPRAAVAEELLERAVARPPGLDERIGGRAAGTPFRETAVRELAERLARQLAGSQRRALYLETLASLLTESGEVELAQAYSAPSVVSTK